MGILAAGLLRTEPFLAISPVVPLGLRGGGSRRLQSCSLRDSACLATSPLPLVLLAITCHSGPAFQLSFVVV